MAADLISNKIAIITGGATGIGEAYVRRLFKSGMKGCTIADTNEEGGALAQEMNCCFGKDKAIFVKADVTNRKAFEDVFKANMDRFKKLDVLINNAGILRDKIWEREIDINATSIVTGSLLGIKYMGKNNGKSGGTIINTASVVGLKPAPSAPCYTGTKHFVVGFTRSIGTKWWYDLTGIRFITLCPGVSKTPMVLDAKEWVFKGFPGLGSRFANVLQQAPSQSVVQCAESLNIVLNEGENGSIWVSDAGLTYEVALPKIHDMKKIVSC